MTTVRALFAAVAAAVLISGVSAQDGPKPGAEHAHLKKIEGTWETTMKMGDMEEKGVATYKMECGGMWLVSTFESQMGGQKFSGRGFDGYDPAKKKYVGVWVDSMAMAPMMMEGDYDAAKKTMTMIGTGPGMDGKPTKHKIVTVMPDDNTMNFAMHMGESKEPTFTIVYKRKK